MSGKPGAAASHIVDWLVEQALKTTTVAAAFEGLVLRLRNEGIEVDRAHVAYTTLHPLHRGSGCTWTLGEGLDVQTYAFDRDQAASGWFDSPVHYAIKHDVPRLRRRLSGPAAMLDFPLLKEFAARGLTDYLLLCSPFDGFFTAGSLDDKAFVPQTAGVITSFATAREGGFTDEEIEALHWLMKPFAVVVKMADQHQIARNLADCYIGKDAGPRVLGGAIQRGDYASTPAVVWLSDLRASTELSNALSSKDFVATINAFFECTAGAVEEEGGEPLAFIGDGALAIFPIDRMGEVGARAAALRAADRATAALTTLNSTRGKAGHAPLRWGIALHAGVLDYGNIGSRTRHSWSAVGAVVNETARLEGLTKVTGETIVASQAFVSKLNDEWRALGAFEMKGVPHPFKVFAPPQPHAHSLAEKEVA